MSTTIEASKSLIAPERIDYDAFAITKLEIEKAAERYMALRVQDADDDEAYNEVHPALQEVRGKRLNVERIRKELKQPYLDGGRKVDEIAKEITALLAPIEAHLKSQYGFYNEEKTRRRKEREEAKRKKIQERIDALAACGVASNPLEVAEWTDEEFDEQLVSAQEAKRLWDEQEAREKAQREAEEAEARAKQEEIERQQRETEERLRKQQEEIEARERAIEEERSKLEAEKRAKEEAERIERERREAAEKAKQEAEAEAERLRQEAAEADRREAMRPDKEKLLAVADVVESITVPEMSGNDQVMVDLREVLISMLHEFAGEIRDKIEAVCRS